MTMTKMVFCVRKQKHISDEDFQDYWLNKHGPLVRTNANALNICRYVQSHTSHSELGEAVASQRGMKVPTFDGIAEIWWESYEDILKALETDEGRAASEVLIADEACFIDLAESTLFFTEEHEVVYS